MKKLDMLVSTVLAYKDSISQKGMSTLFELAINAELVEGVISEY
jgi:hypothetical protein